MYCTLKDRNTEIEQAKRMLGGGNKEREDLIESANDLFIQERYANNTSPRRVNMYPDEYPFTVKADSSEYLTQQLGLEKLEEAFMTSKSKVKELLQTEDPKEVTIKLNDRFRDKLFRVTECGDSFIIKMETKPTEQFKEKTELEETLASPKSILTLIDRLVDYHGVDINYISNYELSKPEWKDVPNATDAKGFIKDGKIYINQDNCTIDTKVHELMHLFLGGVRFIDPKLYFDTIQILQKDPNIQVKLDEFVNRSDSDALEEVFVEEYAKYLTGENNFISMLPEDIRYDLNYNIRRMLDTMFMGDFSNKIIPDNILPGLSMFKIGKVVNSKYVYPKIQYAAALHRKQQNLKAEWLRSGKLIKEC